MTNNSSKCATESTPNYVSLVVRRHVQRRFGFQDENGSGEETNWKSFPKRCPKRIRDGDSGYSFKVPFVLGDDDLDPVLQHARGDERIPKRCTSLAHQLHRMHNRFFATVEYTLFRGTKNLSNDALSLTDWHWSRDFLSSNREKLAQIL
jgi:hypothetical protein